MGLLFLILEVDIISFKFLNSCKIYLLWGNYIFLYLYLSYCDVYYFVGKNIVQKYWYVFFVQVFL